DGPALLAQQVQNGLHGLVRVGGDDLFHPVQGPAEVHGGGPGGVQVLFLLVELPGESGVVRDTPLAGKGVDAVPGADADGGSAPDLQQLDGVVHLLGGAEGQVDRPVGQLGLVDDDDA